MKTDAAFHMNLEQKKAVEYNNGPLLIIAGAGTGKTYVLVEKIKFLIKKKLAKSEGILALTFTEKAASEMEERVDQAMPYGYFQMWISTFHAFADRVLREHGVHIGLNTSYRLLMEAESLLFLKQNLFLLNLNYFRPFGNPNKFLEALLHHFSRLKDEDISPIQYLEWAQNLSRAKSRDQNKETKIETEKNIELAQAYGTYQELKTKEGFLDFSDLVYHTLVLFRKRKNILNDYQTMFSHVMIDEFQDTNISQYSLIKLLCPPKKKPHLTIVGDDSQSIYKFRGASVSNILTFMKDYPQSQQITLQKNYRSNQTILNSAYKMIRNNDPDTLEVKLGISKNLVAQKKNDLQAVKVFIGDRVEEEADFITRTIISLRSVYSFSDFAILSRAHKHSEPFVRALARKGIPYQFVGPGILYKQPEVKDLIAYLKVLYDTEDSVALYRVLTMNIFSLDMKDITALLSFSRKTNLSFFRSIEIYFSFLHTELYQESFENYKQYLPLLSEKTKKILFKIYTMIVKHLSLSKKETAGQLLYYFLEDTGYLQKLVSYKSENDEKMAQNISRFFNKLKTFESEHENASIYATVDYLDMSMELGESPSAPIDDIIQANAVKILTVHSAKGLEFPVVFIVNCTHGRFPTHERKESIPIPEPLIKEILPVGDYHLEEERRLFYVGMTRAKDRLYLSTSKYYGEAKREQRISPFVIEAVGEKTIDQYQTLGKEKRSQLVMFTYEKLATPYKTIDSNITRLPQTTFSYTQLETYERCSLQYKYQYVLKIPTTPGASASFGNTIHKTLQAFYKEFLSDHTIGKEKLLSLYKSCWIPIGYSSKSHEQRMNEEGKKLLTRYFEKFHSPSLHIVDLEKLFKIKLSNNINISGKIDRVDKLSNGIEIIDYKTGKKPGEKELKKNLQLSIYTFAAMDKGLYHMPLDTIRLTFYYLQTMEKVSLNKSIEDLLEVKKSITQTVEKIRTSQYDPNVGPWCNFCSFRLLCEAWQ